MKIIDIDWVSMTSLEASVTVSDGFYNCIVFCCPCNYKINDRIERPLFLFESYGFFLEKNANLMINRHTGNNNFYHHDIVGIIYPENKIIKVGNLLIEYDELVPKDIESGSIVSFTAKRIDLF